MNILLIRTSAMGDVVHSLPVLHALRRAHPEARIGWVVEKAFAPLIQGHPGLDEVFPVKMRGWRKGLGKSAIRREIRTAMGSIRSFQADVAIDLMGNHKAGLLARLSGARRIVGPRKQDRREPSSAFWVHEGVPVDAEHAVDRALAIVRGFGTTEEADFGGSHILPNAPAAARQFLAEREKPYVLIQAGAGWGNKTWPPAFWGDVARRLATEDNVEVWVPVAPGEEHLAEAVAASSQGCARTVDAGPWDVLTALIRGSRLLLGGDTGPLHLADALGTPVLAVMGPTDPRRHGPYSQMDRVVVEPLPCSFCYKRLSEARACLLRIAPANVAGRAREILGQKVATCRPAGRVQ